MRKYSLSIFWSDEDNSFVALSPEFPGMSAIGEDREEALKEAQYAMNTMEDMAKEHGDTLPNERKLPEHSGQFRIRIPRSLHTALALEAERQGVSLNSLVQVYLTQGITEEIGIHNFEQFLGHMKKSRNHMQHSLIAAAITMTVHVRLENKQSEPIDIGSGTPFIIPIKRSQNELRYE